MIGKRPLPIFVIIVILTATLPAQTIAPDTVFVTARVTGSKQQPALGLKADNFQILEDGVEQKVSYVSAPSESWDMRVLLASSAFSPSGGLGPRGGGDPKTADLIRAAFIAFKSAGNSSNKYVVNEQTSSLEYFFDDLRADSLIYPIMTNLTALNNSGNPRRALIVITDGYNGHIGGNPQSDLLKYSEKLNFPIYFMFVSVQARNRPQRLAARGDNETLGASNTPGLLDPIKNTLTKGEYLNDIASRTGGEVHIVAPGKLASRMLQLSMDMKNEYILGFKSTNATKDGRWRKLKITVKSPTGEKLEATSKDKYFVATP